LEQFTLQSIPLVTHMQISDALQEFLCVPDQIKLIDYDNRKLAQIQQALFIDEEMPDMTEAVDSNRLMQQRLESLLELMLQ
jgi:Cu/Ag efflux protein CusF